MNPQLIVFSGLPGAGKSAIAEGVSKQIGAPHFSKDKLEAVLVRSELSAIENDRLGFAGYELLAELADSSLQARVSVILDSVCGRERIRDGWRKIAATYSAPFRVVHCICSDELIHRSRLESRARGIVGWHELDWSEVERVRDYFEPWQQEHLLLDSVEPLEANVRKAVEFLSSKA